METNRRLIWIVMAPGRQCKFHASLLPSAAHKLLTKHMRLNKFATAASNMLLKESVDREN